MDPATWKEIRKWAGSQFLFSYAQHPPSVSARLLDHLPDETNHPEVFAVKCSGTIGGSSLSWNIRVSFSSYDREQRCFKGTWTSDIPVGPTRIQVREYVDEWQRSNWGWISRNL